MKRDTDNRAKSCKVWRISYVAWKFRELWSTLCLKKDTDVAHYNFDTDQIILIIFARYVAERECYQMVIFLSHLS